MLITNNHSLCLFSMWWKILMKTERRIILIRMTIMMDLMIHWSKHSDLIRAIDGIIQKCLLSEPWKLLNKMGLWFLEQKFCLQEDLNIWMWGYQSLMNQVARFLSYSKIGTQQKGRMFP